MTSGPSPRPLTVSLFLCSSRSNPQGDLRALEGHRVSPKSPPRVQGGDKGVAGSNGTDKYFPRSGVVIDRPDDLMMNYIKRKQKKIELVARPVVR